jgi:hypothetical protein
VPVAVESLAVLGTEEGINVQIRVKGAVTTDAQVLSGPDRLVIDFPGAVPGRRLCGLRLNYGKIKAVRAGLWRSNPPVTRVIIDLDEPTGYLLTRAEKSINVSLRTMPRLVASKVFSERLIEQHSAPYPVTNLTQPGLQVQFHRGLLAISAIKATLADVLYQIHLSTGADIPIPAGAEQEQVALQLGPGPAKDVIAALLNGSRFNYVLAGTAQDPQSVATLLLTLKASIGAESAHMPPPPLHSSMATSQEQLAAPEPPPNPPLEPVLQLGANPELTPNPEPPDEQ